MAWFARPPAGRPCSSSLENFGCGARPVGRYFCPKHTSSCQSRQPPEPQAAPDRFRELRTCPSRRHVWFCPILSLLFISVQNLPLPSRRNLRRFPRATIAGMHPRPSPVNLACGEQRGHIEDSSRAPCGGTDADTTSSSILTCMAFCTRSSRLPTVAIGGVGGTGGVGPSSFARGPQTPAHAILPPSPRIGESTKSLSNSSGLPPRPAALGAGRCRRNPTRVEPPVSEPAPSGIPLPRTHYGAPPRRSPP